MTLGISATEVGWPSFTEGRNWLSLTKVASEPESTSDLEILQPYQFFREISVDQCSSVSSFFKRRNGGPRGRTHLMVRLQPLSQGSDGVLGRVSTVILKHMSRELERWLKD